MHRRDFVKQALKLTALPGLLVASCSSSQDYAHIKGSILGASSAVGHLLRDPGKLPKPTETINTNILIAGGGIAGLSARRWLHQHGIGDVMMVEMSDQLGGNSIAGRNQVSAYPWAAHYLPIPDTTNSELISFLQSVNSITGFNDVGLPIYNEYHLCHDPEERLYINGFWQEGIVPQFGISKADSEQIDRFFKYLATLKELKGADGKYVFDIPIAQSSTDEEYRKLDSISFATFLQQNGYTSPYLLWYLEYCCKDDYGATLQNASAWAGLHYFASRRGKAANAPSSAVLTWPQGNNYLMAGLKQHGEGSTHINMLVYNVALKDDKVEVSCYDASRKTTLLIRANKLLLSTPQYVNKHLLASFLPTHPHLQDTPAYAPWVIANITLNKLKQGRGTPLCWDNVIYGQDAVGYVYANHQDLSQRDTGVITYYLPLVYTDPVAARNEAHSKDYSYWRNKVITELNFAHPGIDQHITQLDVWVWGHGMVRPTPGYIWGAGRQEAIKPIDNKIFFAHSDLSGISIFEEAFYHGIRAAKEMIS